MPTNEKKGVTVKIDAKLHAEVRRYIEEHEMTMGDFVSMALQDELHPKLNMQEDKNMGNIRTLAFQVPEELFQKIKDYLQRNNMTQKQFVVGLIETEINRDLAQRATQAEQHETDTVCERGGGSEQSEGVTPRNSLKAVLRKFPTARTMKQKIPMRTRILTKTRIRTSPKKWECLWECEIPYVIRVWRIFCR